MILLVAPITSSRQIRLMGQLLYLYFSTFLVIRMYFVNHLGSVSQFYSGQNLLNILSISLYRVN
jgi:hypothetical protein